MGRPLLTEDLRHFLVHTQELWEEVRDQRIFVTGGTGFFGCWLLETFAFANSQLALNAKLVALTRSPEAFRKKASHLAKHPAIELCEGDVRDFKFPDEEYSHVIHAGTTSGSVVEPVEMLETVVEGTRHVLDFAKAHGTRKLLLTSSGAVYGKQPPELSNVPEIYEGVMQESDPNFAYGGGKRQAEQLCMDATELECKIARCFAFVGPHLPLDAHFAIGNFIRDALAGKPIQIKGDGRPLRSYLYMADLAIWLWTILFKGQSNHPYNVGSGEAVSIGDLAKRVAAVVSPGLPVEISGTPGEGLPPRYVPDVKRAETELALRPFILLNEAISRTARWYSPV